MSEQRSSMAGYATIMLLLSTLGAMLGWEGGRRYLRDEWPFVADRIQAVDESDPERLDVPTIWYAQPKRTTEGRWQVFFKIMPCESGTQWHKCVSDREILQTSGMGVRLESPNCVKTPGLCASFPIEVSLLVDGELEPRISEFTWSYASADGGTYLVEDFVNTEFDTFEMQDTPTIMNRPTGFQIDYTITKAEPGVYHYFAVMFAEENIRFTGLALPLGVALEDNWTVRCSATDVSHKLRSSAMGSMLIYDAPGSLVCEPGEVLILSGTMYSAEPPNRAGFLIRCAPPEIESHVHVEFQGGIYSTPCPFSGRPYTGGCQIPRPEDLKKASEETKKLLEKRKADD